MTQEELEKRVMAMLNEILLERNFGEKVCICGEVILDRDRSSEALEQVMSFLACYILAFATLADDPSVRIHAPNIAQLPPRNQLH